MDIKRQYFDLIQKKIDTVYNNQHNKFKEVAKLFGDCMTNGGVVQLFGVKHGEEFVNELNYRAGGIAPFHGFKLKDMMLKGLVNQADIVSGKIYSDTKVADLFLNNYQVDDRDMIAIVSYTGSEPLVLELAKKYKAKGQKVVALINKKTYDKSNSNLLDYCDCWIDMEADDPDIALNVGGLNIGQASSTVSNVMAQMITADLYRYFVERGKEAPVLLSANVKNADIHNNSLTDPYERRVR